MLIDLHSHSTESDGSLSIAELVSTAAAQELKALALCDHDTTAGCNAFVAEAQRQGITAITGVEISAEWNRGNCHILGLGIQPGYGALEEMLAQTRDSRDNRNHHIIKKLQQNAIPVTLAEVERYAGGDVVGRPHMARLMVDKGFVQSTQDAFDRFLAKGQCAYVDRFRLPPAQAVQLIREAGAVPVLAHPSQLKLDEQELEHFVGTLCDAGLMALEVYTPYTTDDMLPRYRAIAEKYSLAISGGSDFHGASKPTHVLGYYRSDTAIPESCFTAISHCLSTAQQ